MKPGKSVVSHFSTIQDNDDRRFPVRLKLQVQNPKVKTQYATRRKPEGKLCTRSRSYEQDRARRIPTSNGHTRNLGLRNKSTASIAHAFELGGTKTRSRRCLNFPDATRFATRIVLAELSSILQSSVQKG